MNTDERNSKRVKFAEGRGQKRQGDDVEELEANAEEQDLDDEVEMRSSKTNLQDRRCRRRYGCRRVRANADGGEVHEQPCTSKTKALDKIEESLRQYQVVDDVNDDKFMELLIFSNECMKAPRSDSKKEFVKKETGWLRWCKDIADVLRGDGRWKHDRRHVRMTGKSETASEYLVSFVVEILSSIKLQMILDGAINAGEMHFAGPVPDEGGHPTELEVTCCIDGTWIDPKLLSDGRS